MTQAAKGVTAESSLQDLSALSAVKKRAPLFKLSYTIGGFLGVNLSHAPVVKQLAAAHGVAKMCAPVVGRVYIGHRGSDSTLRHDRMSFSEKRFAYHSHLRTLRQSAQGRSQPRATGADYQHIVVVGFVICSHNSLRSVTAPLATNRM